MPEPVKILKILQEAAEIPVNMEMISQASKIHCKFTALGYLEVMAAVQKLTDRIDKLEKTLKSK